MASEQLEVIAAASCVQRFSLSQRQVIDRACLQANARYFVVPDVSAQLALVRIEKPEAVLLFDLVSLHEAHDLHGFVANDRTILCLAERDASDLLFKPGFLNGVRFLVGLGIVELAQPSLEAILEHVATGNSGVFSGRAFRGESLHLVRRRLKHSAERVGLQDWVESFFVGELQNRGEVLAGGTGLLPKLMAMVVDELLMNAIWDANDARAKQDRSVGVTLNEHESVLVDVLAEGPNLGIAVHDSHGTFPMDVWPRTMVFALDSRKRSTVNTGPGGAGIGLKMIVRKVALLVVEIDRGCSTRVLAIVRADHSLRDHQRQAPSMLFFERTSRVST